MIDVKRLKNHFLNQEKQFLQKNKSRKTIN